MSGQVRILETTIRDGGYMVDHHFSRAQIATIVAGLDQAGFPLIEVGHGMGALSERFVATELRPKMLPRLDSIGHALASIKVATHAQIGVLLCAGPRHVPLDGIDQLADLGFSFVRLAIMPDESVDSLAPYIRRAKERGLLVSVNMMQTYARPPEVVAEFAVRAADVGMDWFYVVDSAGGMTTDQVKRYVSAVLRRAPVAVGLHSHNNVGCAVANSVAAVEAGATLVDGTLNGMGRATGNPPTEQLALVLRDKLAHPVELDAVIGISRTVRSVLERGDDPIDYVSGGALVHSRNVGKAIATAHARGRSPAAFLLELGREAGRQVEVPIADFPPEVYDAATERVPATARVEPGPAVVHAVTSDVLARHAGGTIAALETLLLSGQQYRLPTVLHLSRGAAAICDRAIPWRTPALAGITLPWIGELPSIEPTLRPDYLLVDGDGAPGLTPRRASWVVSFADLFGRAVRDVGQLLRARGATLWNPGGAHLDLVGDLPCETGDRRGNAPHALLVGAEPLEPSQLRAGDTVIALGAMSPRLVDAVRARGAEVLRPPWTAAVAGAAATLLALEADTAGTDGALIPNSIGRGTGQVTWDPASASLLEADDPGEAARLIADRFIAAFWNGQRGF